MAPAKKTAAAPELNPARLADIRRRLNALTPMEQAVLPHLIAGRTRTEIGALLGRSPRTIDVHATRINKRLATHSFAEVVMYVLAVQWNVVRAHISTPVVELEASAESKLECFVCGAEVALLGTHIWRRHEMAPADYIAKFSLRADYPMTAPATREQRQRQAEKADLKNTSRQRRWRPSKATDDVGQ